MYSCFLVGCNDNSENIEPTISVFEQTFDEGNGTTSVDIIVSLSQPSSLDISVEAFTSDGTAKKGLDYESYSGIIFIDAGELEARISIDVYGNSKYSPDKEFYFNLKDANRAKIGLSTARIIIKNDDENVLFIPESGYETPNVYDGMNLVWSDEFDGESLNLENWTYETGNGTQGWGNFELEYYTNQNDRLVDGNLVIEAREESRNGFNYTSSRIITQNNIEVRYGRIDIRAVMPYGKGLWPALWMLGANFKSVGWPACGEIDIMEMVGGGVGDSEAHGTVHWNSFGTNAKYGGSTILESGILNDEFHVYSIEWDASKITWYLDDKQYHVIDTTPQELSAFRESFFFIFNVAVGGNWPGSPDASTVFPQWMIVDYVRVFQKN